MKDGPYVRYFLSYNGILEDPTYRHSDQAVHLNYGWFFVLSFIFYDDFLYIVYFTTDLLLIVIKMSLLFWSWSIRLIQELFSVNSIILGFGSLANPSKWIKLGWFSLSCIVHVILLIKVISLLLSWSLIYDMLK